MSRFLFVNPPLDPLAETPKIEGTTEFYVHSRFFTIQGEGHWTGTPAWFIRLQGCSVGCPWCDTKDSWAAGKETMGLVELVNEIPLEARHVVITGGEPYEQNIRRLLAAIYLSGRRVQIETSGCCDAYGPSWVTVSPKFFKPLSLVALKCASEIKQVVCSESDIERMQKEVLPYISVSTPVSLQPVSNGKRAMELCIDACKKYGYNLSVQTHKLIGIE